MIVVVGNTKGGVGKTTLAVQIALRRAMTGGRMAFVDGDRQGSGTDALLAREEGVKPAGWGWLTSLRIDDGRKLVTYVESLTDQRDVVIDVGGRDSSALRGALTVADVVLVPFMPSALDLWALQDMKTLCDAAGHPRVRAVPNCADAYGTRAAVAAVREIGLEVVDAVIHRRRAFLTATGEGLCVWETPSRHRNRNACSELDALIQEVFQ